MTARDRAHGWNWTYWQNVQRPLVEELSGPAHRDALLAPKAPFTVKADAADVLVGARETADAIYVIAVRRGGATGRVRFSGLPAAAGAGTVLAHGPGNPPRPVAAHAGGFTDPSPYEPHNARVYRFARG
jgi:hypothetical protein